MGRNFFDRVFGARSRADELLRSLTLGGIEEGLGVRKLLHATAGDQDDSVGDKSGMTQVMQNHQDRPVRGQSLHERQKVEGVGFDHPRGGLIQHQKRGATQHRAQNRHYPLLRQPEVDDRRGERIDHPSLAQFGNDPTDVCDLLGPRHARAVRQSVLQVVKHSGDQQLRLLYNQRRPVALHQLRTPVTGSTPMPHGRVVIVEPRQGAHEGRFSGARRSQQDSATARRQVERDGLENDSVVHRHAESLQR